MDGRDWLDKVVGVAIGVATNIIPGSTDLRNRYEPNDARDYNTTLKTVDNTAAVVGAGAMILGADEMAAGASLAAGGLLATVSIVGAEGGVPAMAAGGTIALKGAITTGAGALLMSNSAANQKAGYDYGKKENNSNTGTQTDNLPKLPKGKGSVDPSQRDPKRVYSKSEKADMLKNQGGKCAGCGDTKTVKEVEGQQKKMELQFAKIVI
jgi:type IV secretory pathway TrbL component